MDLNHRPPVCEPIFQDIAEYNRLKFIKQNQPIVEFQPFLTLSYFILFYSVPLEIR